MIEKSIKNIAWNVTEEEYRADKAKSYSTLSRFAREGVSCIPHLMDKIDSEPLRFGSLVDTVMTDASELDNKFMIVDFPKPTESIVKIVTAIWENSDKKTNILAKIDPQTILMHAGNEDYQKNWKEETKINKIVFEGQGYFELLALTEGKMVVTQSDLGLAEGCRDNLKSSNYTSKYFYDNPMKPNVEGHYQLKFKFTFILDGITYHVRCMFDRIIVDHEAKTIQPLDLKTTGKPEEEFSHSFLQWRYDLQATMYSWILAKVCKEDDYFKDFTILPFKFICINRYNQKPLVWTYKDSLICSERFGVDGIKYKSWYTLLKELTWHIDNNKLDYSYEVYQQQGEMELDNLFLEEIWKKH